MKPPNLHEERSLLSQEQLARWHGLPVGWYTVAPATFTRHDGHALPLLAMIDCGHARAELGFSTHTEYKDLGAGAIGLFSGRVEGRYSRWNCRSVRRIMLSLSADALAGAGMLSEELIEAPWAQDTEFYDPEVTAVLRCMVREIAAGSPNGRLYAQSLSMGLVLHLSRNRRAQGRLARERGRLSTDQQRRLRDFIHADLAADLSLDSLARAVGYSPSQFTRLFRNSFGKSAHRYVLTQRVAKAQALLRESALPLADIAQSCGFSGQSHMTSVFTRELGMSPGVLRRLHRTSSSSARDRDDG